MAVEGLFHLAGTVAERSVTTIPGAKDSGDCHGGGDTGSVMVQAPSKEPWSQPVFEVGHHDGEEWPEAVPLLTGSP